MIGLYTGVSAAFGFALSILSRIIGRSHNWRCCFLLNGISVISVALVFLFIPDTAQDKDEKGGGLLSVLCACTRNNVFKIIFEYFVSSTLYCILFVFVDIYVSEKGIGDSVVSGSISSLGSVITFLMGLVFPAIFTKLKEKLPSICLFGMSTAFLILLKATGLYEGVLGFALAAVFFSIVYSYYQTKLGLLVPLDEAEGCFGVLNAAYNVACFISAYVPYKIIALIGKDKVFESFGVFDAVMFVLGTANIGMVSPKAKCD